jgi:hypothetical protein
MRKKRVTRKEEEFEEPQPLRKSLGKLVRNSSKTPRSPELTGECKIQGHFIRTLFKELERSDSDEVICNIAAWRNVDNQGNKYVTIELSHKFRKHERQGAQGDIFHFMRATPVALRHPNSQRKGQGAWLNSRASQRDGIPHKGGHYEISGEDLLGR